MITGVILARNESENIVECVNAIRPHVSQLILIDMDSSDDTVSLVNDRVDLVLHHSLVANFDPVRNMAIEHSNNEWLWFVDADERVSEQTAAAVNELITKQGDSFEAINIPFKTYFAGKWIQHSGWWPGYTMPRVLKKGYFKFSERLHGGVELNGREIRIPPDPNLGIDHFSYSSVEHYIEKFNRYTSTEASQLAHSNQSIDWRNGVAHMIHDLWMYYERNQGNLDGRHGWILAWLSGQYRWVSHAKLLDKNPQATEPGALLYPESLSEVFAVIDQELERLRSTEFRLPDGIVWRSPIWDPSGYADEGRCIAKALSQTDLHVSLENIAWNDTKCEISTEDRSLFRALSRCKRADTNIVITNCIPTLVEPDRSATLNVLRTTFETDRIPDEWLSRIESFDEVWVISKQNELSFRRSGVAPEKMRRVPSFIDTQLYQPDGDKFPLPAELENKFVFLSVFDWQIRKGWDLLLKAYCETFSSDDPVGLLLKVSRMHGHTIEHVRAQANQYLQTIGQNLADRNDIYFLDEFLSANEMASLYRTADAFVLPSRGEGWGRPYMEAMSCGVATIGTNASGNIDFMNSDNSELIDATVVPVPENAWQEIPPYRGHCWWEPDVEQLAKSMKKIFDDEEFRTRLGKVASQHIHENFGIQNGRAFWETAIEAAKQRFIQSNAAHQTTEASKPKLVLEGELFANHSFANINEQFASMFADDGFVNFSIDRKYYNPVSDRDGQNVGKITRYIGAHSEQHAAVTIRHSFPPNWEKPATGKWVHIQPWEFGHLPIAWLQPLAEQVDEIWAPSHYVRNVYIKSGIPQEKIFVIPWGIDPSVFNPDVPARILPTERAFKFVFVGGTIARKGFDRLLEAYLAEFSDADDVSLVVKDLGTKTFYRFGNYQQAILDSQAKDESPEIIYFDDQWTPGQLASLYAACDCLAFPYRGEGFGLPILEAMACGVTPIVPTNGASDDFVTPETGLLIDGTPVETSHEWPLAGPPLELDVDIDELRAKMRWAYENREELKQLGNNASNDVAQNWTWHQSFELVKDRIDKLVDSESSQLANTSWIEQNSGANLAICIKTKNDEHNIANCISRYLPDIKEIIVFDDDSTDETVAIANEYGIEVISLADVGEQSIADFAIADWLFEITPDVFMSDDDIRQMIELVSVQPEFSRQVTFSLAPSPTRTEAIELNIFRNPHHSPVTASV